MHSRILAAIIVAIIATLLFIAPGWSEEYPVSGQWGQVRAGDQGAVDCKGRRVVNFNGHQRTDTGGGVPAYRNRTVTGSGDQYRVQDEFTTGQIHGGRVTYNLRKVDGDRIEIDQPGGKLTLQRCK